MDVELTVDLSDFERRMSRLARDQVPFATALTLTRVTLHARDELREDLPNHFVIRNRWTERGVVAKTASKRDLEAIVGHRDEYMARQATGGTKRPKSASLVAIPKAARPRPTSPTPRSRWPRQMLARARTFVRRLPGGKLALLQRAGKGRFPLKVLYLFAPQVNVPARWPLLRTVEKAIADVWVKTAEDAWKRALRTAR